MFIKQSRIDVCYGDLILYCWLVCYIAVDKSDSVADRYVLLPMENWTNLNMGEKNSIKASIYLVTSTCSLTFFVSTFFVVVQHNSTDGMALGSAFLIYGSVGGWSRIEPCFFYLRPKRSLLYFLDKLDNKHNNR